MKKSTGTGVNVGGASILVIFVLLCLTTFATLSMVSANADLRLSKRTAEATAAYYTADAAAQETLGELQSALAALDDPDAQTYFSQAEQLVAPLGVGFARDGDAALLTYMETVDDEHELHVRVRLGAPASTEQLTLEAWQVVYTGQWEADDSLMLWDGGEEMNLMGS